MNFDFSISLNFGAFPDHLNGTTSGYNCIFNNILMLAFIRVINSDQSGHEIGAGIDEITCLKIPYSRFRFQISDGLIITGMLHLIS